jgi:hypothetical protein
MFDTGGMLHVVMDPVSTVTAHSVWLRVRISDSSLRAYLHCFQGFDGDIPPSLGLGQKDATVSAPPDAVYDLKAV